MDYIIEIDFVQGKMRICGIFEKFFKNFVACVQLFKYNKKLLTFFCFQIKKIHTLYAKPRFKTGGSYEKF